MNKTILKSPHQPNAFDFSGIRRKSEMRLFCLERRVCCDHVVEDVFGLKDAGSQSSSECFSSVSSKFSLKSTAQSQLYLVQ